MKAAETTFDVAVAARGGDRPSSAARTEAVSSPRVDVTLRLPPLRLQLLEPQVSAGRTVLRSLRWMVGGGSLLSRIVWDNLHGRREPRSRGRRLRELFERMGGTAVKVGQQLSVRIDLLPFEVCDELAKLLDHMPAFDVSHAIERIEATAGKPIDEIFDAFDPEPIGAASIACVYQAYLKSGEHVAVKVRRPDVARHFATDLRFIDWFTFVPEMLGLVKPGFFKYLRTELRAMLLEELDFSREARYQRLFRREARKSRVDWLTAPRVYTEYSGVDVLVSEFVSGIWCGELLAACEAGDTEFIARAAADGISPKKVASRLLHTQFWSCYESLFFHADPHPSNVLVQPGSRLVFLDFGACGTTARPVQRHQQALLDRLVRNDVGGMATVAMHLLEPLPPIDTFKFRRRIEDAYHRVIYALRDKESKWWERTTMSLWLAMVQVTREFQMPINLDVMRQFRSSLLYDTLAFRLNGKLDLPREYGKYKRQATHRAFRRSRRQLERITPRQARERVVYATDGSVERGQDASWGIETMVEKLPVELQSAINKGAYLTALALRFVTRTTMVMAASMAFVLLWRRFFGQRADSLWSVAQDALRNPVVLTVLIVMVFVHLRHALLRLRERDDQGRPRRRLR